MKENTLSEMIALFELFVRTALTLLLYRMLKSLQPPTNRKSHPGKPNKPTKPNVIQYSLSVKEDVQLKRIQNAWLPLRLQTAQMSEEQTKTFSIISGVRGVLNKLTPEKFGRLMELIKELEIDTSTRLQHVISLVFEKAVDEPCYSVEYAQLCKELGPLEVKDPEVEGAVITFKKLIITRCQKEFEKNPNDDIIRNKALKEIDDCPDPVSAFFFFFFFFLFSLDLFHFVVFLFSSFRSSRECGSILMFDCVIVCLLDSTEGDEAVTRG